MCKNIDEEDGDNYPIPESMKKKAAELYPKLRYSK
jgi:hypothetical protein